MALVTKLIMDEREFESFICRMAELPSNVKNKEDAHMWFREERSTDDEKWGIEWFCWKTKAYLCLDELFPDGVEVDG